MSGQPKSRAELSDEELERTEGEPLPDRELMSLVHPDLELASADGGLTPPHHERPVEPPQDT